MAKGATSRTDAGVPLDEAAILEGLKRSGFPFELELLRAFDQHGLDPVNGFRLRVAEGEARPMRSDDLEGASAVTREVDIMVSVQVTRPVNVTRAEGEVDLRRPITARLMAAVEAKSLPPSAAFVGFPFRQPDAYDRMIRRCRFAGAPCHAVLPGYDEAKDLAFKLAGTLAPINRAPHCVQWAVVERGKEGIPRADHPANWAGALSNLARALHLLAIEDTKYQLRVSPIVITQSAPS